MSLEISPSICPSFTQQDAQQSTGPSPPFAFADSTSSESALDAPPDPIIPANCTISASPSNFIFPVLVHLSALHLTGPEPPTAILSLDISSLNAAPPEPIIPAN